MTGFTWVPLLIRQLLLGLQQLNLIIVVCYCNCL